MNFIVPFIYLSNLKKYVVILMLLSTTAWLRNIIYNTNRTINKGLTTILSNPEHGFALFMS